MGRNGATVAGPARRRLKFEPQARPGGLARRGLELMASGAGGPVPGGPAAARGSHAVCVYTYVRVCLYQKVEKLDASYAVDCPVHSTQ
eukprot:SAG22_NODE_43_length_25304_cov_5.394644_19_plen_88_part_00